MREKELQDKLIDLIKNESFKESINNLNDIESALKGDMDDKFIPHMSIDDLLNKKYSKVASLVLKSLDSYEIVSGNSIKNISLQSKEFLYPDVILFNTESCQLIVIENKISSKTGREAITEIFGYANEIRNHLPFFSDYDICFIIISTHFNTLLDHSISSKILSSNINLLCLTPEIIQNKLSFNIHFPKSWTHIGQNNLPANALVSYSWGLRKKEVDIDFDAYSVIDLARELIVTDANKNNSSGFMIIWKNGLPQFSMSEYTITIYVINSFAFLPNARATGFKVNEKSVLLKHIEKFSNEHGELIYPQSIFNITNEAKKFLNNYFHIEIDSASEWSIDIQNELNRLHRLPFEFDSWGIIGDYVRYFYFHPAVRKYYFHSKDDEFRGHFSPIIGLQIINLITNKTLFKSGQLFASDLFKFGQQLARYNHASDNALNSQKEISRNALLFWSILEISQSLKEIQSYSNNVLEIDNYDLTIHLALKSENIKNDYLKTNDLFRDNFIKIFLDDSENLVHRNVFEMGYSYGMYFIPFYCESIDFEAKKMIEKQVSNFIKKYLKHFISSYKGKNMDLGKKEIAFLEECIDSNILKTKIENIIKIIDNKSDIAYITIFEKFLENFVDSISGAVYHNVKKYNISSSFNWKWMRESLSLKFIEGLKYGVINLQPNGTISISQLEEDYHFMGKLKNKDEVFLNVFQATGMNTILKINWDDVESGKAFENI